MVSLSLKRTAPIPPLKAVVAWHSNPVTSCLPLRIQVIVVGYALSNCLINKAIAGAAIDLTTFKFLFYPSFPPLLRSTTIRFEPPFPLSFDT